MNNNDAWIASRPILKSTITANTNEKIKKIPEMIIPTMMCNLYLLKNRNPDLNYTLWVRRKQFTYTPQVLKW